MSIIYKSLRVGKYGKEFELYKFRTLKDKVDTSSSFAQEDQYARFGKFLRKTKLDELPSLINILKGHMGIFGYRPEEPRTFNILPDHMKELLGEYKPGLMDLSSLHFFNEEGIVQLGEDAHEVYWKRIRPIKYSLQVFYLQNKCFLLNMAILYLAVRKILKSFFK